MCDSKRSNDSKSIAKIVGNKERDDDNGVKKKLVGSGVLATAVIKSILAPIFIFLRNFIIHTPIRLFRPARTSSFMILQAMAQSEDRPLNLRYLQRIYRVHGSRFFLTNMSAPLIANTVVGVTLFSSFQLFSHIYGFSRSADLDSDQLDRSRPFAAGALAGLVTSMVSTPVDYLKLHFRLSDLMVTRRYKNAYDYAFKSLFPPPSTSPPSPSSGSGFGAGIRRAYRGYSITACKDVIGYSIFFGLYENSKDLIYQQLSSSTSTSSIASTSTSTSTVSAVSGTGGARLLQSVASVSAGLLTATVYMICTHPFDIIRLEYHKHLRLTSLQHQHKHQQPQKLTNQKLYNVRQEKLCRRRPLVETLKQVSMNIGGTPGGVRKVLFHGFNSLTIGKSLLPFAFALLAFDWLSGDHSSSPPSLNLINP